MDYRNAAQQVAEALKGTCNDIEVATESVLGISDAWNDLPQEFFDSLDEYVMQCDCCGWWCASEEIDDNSNCEDCL